MQRSSIAPSIQRKRAVQDILINVYWLGLAFMWNCIHPLLLPVLLLTYTEKAKNTAYGMLTFVGLLIAMIVQPLAGTLSDKTRHRLGRRRPWIILGTLMGIGFLWVMIVAGRLWIVAIGYFGLQFCSNLAHGAAQGLIPDLIPVDRRGRASGLKNLFDMLGMVFAATTAGRILGAEPPRMGVMVAVIMSVQLVAMTATCLGVHERPTRQDGDNTDPPNIGESMHELLNTSVNGLGDYAKLLTSRFLVFLGTFSIQAYALYYCRDVLQVATPARTVGRLMTLVGLCVVLVVYPAGVLSERLGRKKLSLVACSLAAVGMGLLTFIKSAEALPLIGCLIGLGMGIFASVNWAWATDLVPANEAGKYLGLSNIATAGSSAASRLLGPLVDVVNGIHVNAGYTMLFMLTTLGALAAIIVTLHITDVREATRIFLLEQGQDKSP